MKEIDFDKVMILLQGSHELLGRVIEVAVPEWNEQLAILAIAIDEQNFEEIKKPIHRIKGSVKSLYFQRLVTKLEDLEQAAAKKESRDWPAHFSSIKKDLEFLELEVQNYLKFHV